jgi:hypothetical protein
MRRHYWFPIIPLALAVVMGAIVMLLWNALLPVLLNVPRIDYWQAIGLLILSRILFGGFGIHRAMHRDGPFSHRHWPHLSSEEREKLRQEWYGRCGCGSSSVETHVPEEGPAQPSST